MSSDLRLSNTILVFLRYFQDQYYYIQQKIQKQHVWYSSKIFINFTIIHLIPSIDDIDIFIFFQQSIEMKVIDKLHNYCRQLIPICLNNLMIEMKCDEEKVLRQISKRVSTSIKLLIDILFTYILFWKFYTFSPLPNICFRMHSLFRIFIIIPYCRKLTNHEINAS